jgi:transcriptional regulator with XRE-family HTH domain
MPTDLKSWLQDQGLSARQLAKELDVPRTTVEDWVYKGAIPSPERQALLEAFMAEHCIHHWVNETAAGHESQGACQKCGERRVFENSFDSKLWFGAPGAVFPRQPRN